MTAHISSNPTREHRVLLGYKGFRRLSAQWQNTATHRAHNLVLGSELQELSKVKYWLLARYCAKLTEREATSVINAVCFEGLNHEPEAENLLWDAYQKFTSYLDLNYRLSNLTQIVTACCEASPANDDPYYAMHTAVSDLNEGLESVSQAFRENIFGLGRKRTNHLRGDAMNLLSDRRIPADEVEWFGANWKTVTPLWVFLSAERTLTRARVDALLNKSEDTPSSLLDGVL